MLPCQFLREPAQQQQAGELGHRIIHAMHRQIGDLDGVVKIRGRGLMIGIQLDRPCAELVAQALEQGLLINVTADSVIRLLPPLILSEQQADHLVATLSPLIRAFLTDQ